MLLVLMLSTYQVVGRTSVLLHRSCSEGTLKNTPSMPVWYVVNSKVTALILIVGCVQLVYPAPLLEAVMGAAAAWTETKTEDESAMIALTSPPPSFEPMIGVIVFYNGSVEEGKKHFKAFYDVGPVADTTREMPYSDLNSLQVRAPRL